MKMNTANKLTLLRVFLIPVLDRKSVGRERVF